MEVIIDGVRYVRADTQPNDRASKLLSEVYNALWGEAYYDAYSKQIGDFAKPLADKMIEANQILKFRG